MLDRFAREVAKFPDGGRASAVMACLAIVQHEQGFVAMADEDSIAAYLGMPTIAVHEVSTFYNMYNTQAVGKFKLNVKFRSISRQVAPLSSWNRRQRPHDLHQAL